jgi:hypothetical protein
MADYRGHIAAGALFYAILAGIGFGLVPFIAAWDALYGIEYWWEIPAQLAVAILAALWPDVDAMSQGRRLYYRVFLVVDVFLMVTGRWKAAALLGLLAILPGIGRHRGWTHSVWAVLLMPLPILVVPMFLKPDWNLGTEPQLEKLGVGLPYYVAAIAGYLSHLAADGMFTGVAGRISRILLTPIWFIRKTAANDHERL